MKRLLYLAAGWTAFGLGMLGVFLPLLPTVPFIILAAFCFARSNQRLERWLVEHRQFGPHIRRWRERGAISMAGKRAALIMFAISAAVGLFALQPPWAFVPLAAALIGGGWIWTRPSA